MTKIILFLTLSTFSYSADKWEYLLGEFSSQIGFTTIDSTYGGDVSSNKYTTLIERGDKDPSYYTRVALKLALNKMGEDGWELIDIAQTPLNPAKTQREIKHPHLATVFYFKRKITNQP